MTEAERPLEICDHCGRADVGSWRAGRAVFKRKGKTLVVCSPHVADRPKCDKLVSSQHHPPNCSLCMLYNPPGTELRYRTRLVGATRPTAPAAPPTIQSPQPQPVPAYIQDWATQADRRTRVPPAVVEAVRRGLRAGWTIGEIAATIGISHGRTKSVMRRHGLNDLSHIGRGGGRPRQRATLFDPEEFL